MPGKNGCAGKFDRMARGFVPDAQGNLIGCASDDQRMRREI